MRFRWFHQKSFYLHAPVSMYGSWFFGGKPLRLKYQTTGQRSQHRQLAPVSMAHEPDVGRELEQQQQQQPG